MKSGRKINDYIKEKKERAINDDNKFSNGVFQILKTGVPWNALLPSYGKWCPGHKRFWR